MGTGETPRTHPGGAGFADETAVLEDAGLGKPLGIGGRGVLALGKHEQGRPAPDLHQDRVVQIDRLDVFAPDQPALVLIRLAAAIDGDDLLARFDLDGAEFAVIDGPPGNRDL